MSDKKKTQEELDAEESARVSLGQSGFSAEELAVRAAAHGEGPAAPKPVAMDTGTQSSGGSQ